jgi:sRNA-binding protein
MAGRAIISHSRFASRAIRRERLFARRKKKRKKEKKEKRGEGKKNAHREGVKARSESESPERRSRKRPKVAYSVRVATHCRPTVQTSLFDSRRVFSPINPIINR